MPFQISRFSDRLYATSFHPERVRSQSPATLSFARGSSFTFTSGGANQKYRAVFCHSDNASVWPTAIKIRFNLADPDAPKEFDMGNSGYLGAGSVYDETTQTFNVGALVEYGGRTYRCVQINGANTSVGYQLPTNTAYWCLSGTYFEIICPISQ